MLSNSQGCEISDFAFRAAMKPTVCWYQGWILGERMQLPRPLFSEMPLAPLYQRCRGAPFESFALSFCIVLNLVQKLKCEKI